MMISVAPVARNPYENMEIEQDVLFFKLGAPGLVCFHGKNYNIRQRMTTEQINRLTADDTFYRVSADCYVNVKKVRSIANDRLYFGEMGPESKSLPVSKRHQQMIRHLAKMA